MLCLPPLEYKFHMIRDYFYLGHTVFSQSRISTDNTLNTYLLNKEITIF